MNTQEISEKLSTLYGVEDIGWRVKDGIMGSAITSYDLWLADDSERLSDLCDEHGINVVLWVNKVVATYHLFGYGCCEEKYADHPSRLHACRYARAMALVKLKESK